MIYHSLKFFNFCSIKSNTAAIESGGGFNFTEGSIKANGEPYDIVMFDMNGFEFLSYLLSQVNFFLYVFSILNQICLIRFFYHQVFH